MLGGEGRIFVLVCLGLGTCNSCQQGGGRVEVYDTCVSKGGVFTLERNSDLALVSWCGGA